MDYLILVTTEPELSFVIKYTLDHLQLLKQEIETILVARLGAGTFN